MRRAAVEAIASAASLHVILAAPRRHLPLHLMLHGTGGAAVGMNIAPGVKAARRSTSVAPIAITAGVFVAVGLLRWPTLAVVACLAPLSIALAWRRGRG